MNINKKEVLEIEHAVEILMEEKRKILASDRDLTSSEVDRLFDIAVEIDRHFEAQSMLLPLIEDERTAGRWSPLAACEY